MAAGRAFGRLGDGAVVEPDDDVPAVLPARRDRDRAALAVEDDERAGGIEADPGDALGPHARRLQGTAHAGTDRLPDILGALLGMIRLRPIEQDGPLIATEQAARPVEDARSGAAGSDVHRDHQVLHRLTSLY